MTIITRISHRTTRSQTETGFNGSSSAASRSRVVSKYSRSSFEIHFASRGWSLIKNHQMGSQMNGNMPSKMSIVCQP